MRALLIACVLVSLPVRGAPGDELYTRPGQLVPADGTRLNLYCMGTGSPAVVFDSGWEDWAPVWTLVQPQVAKWTRACSYDRAGAGFSEAGPMPRTSTRIADELHHALRNAGITGPYILVGHASGGDNVRTYADRYLEDVAGLVLVEADVGAPVEERSDPQHIAELRACRDAIAAEHGAAPRVARPSGPSRSCTHQFFRGLPEPVWSAELNATLLKIAQDKPALYDAYASEMEQMPANEAYLAHNRRSLGARPLRVLSTGNHGIGTFDPNRQKNAKQQKFQQDVIQAQARWLELSSDSRQIFAERSSEYLPFDQPELVVGAIREVFEAAH